MRRYQRNSLQRYFSEGHQEQGLSIDEQTEDEDDEESQQQQHDQDPTNPKQKADDKTANAYAQYAAHSQKLLDRLNRSFNRSHSEEEDTTIDGDSTDVTLSLDFIDHQKYMANLIKSQASSMQEDDDDGHDGLEDDDNMEEEVPPPPLRLQSPEPEPSAAAKVIKRRHSSFGTNILQALGEGSRAQSRKYSIGLGTFGCGSGGGGSSNSNGGPRRLLGARRYSEEHVMFNLASTPEVYQKQQESLAKKKASLMKRSASIAVSKGRRLSGILINSLPRR